MPLENRRALAILLSASALAIVLLGISVFETSQLPLHSSYSLFVFACLFLLTVAAARLRLPVTNLEGERQSQKSFAEASVFLAVMLYAVEPASTVGPAVILSAIAAAIASLGEGDRPSTIFTTSTGVVSTFLAGNIYALLIKLLAVGQGDTSLNTLLLPLSALAVVHYGVSTLAIAAYSAIATGKNRLVLSRESLVWTAVTQIAATAAAALFYFALNHGSVPHAMVGILLLVLVYLLFRFDERRVDEAHKAQLEKMRHVEEMAALHMNTIESLAIAIDAKDQTTYGHVRRTQVYATEIGRLLNVSEPEMRALKAGALLHDIGKLAVPSYILNKPGRLTESEFAKMKIHPSVGADILRRVNFPYPVEDIVRYHHEKWDGSGYPKGLKGENIPLVARIISVVDFYDATRCDRPYRPGMSREDSLALLQKMAGFSFDPKVVEVFVKNIEDFDRLIATQDIREQVQSEDAISNAIGQPDASLAAQTPDRATDLAGFRSIAEAQREVFALHEIAQTIGSSLNLNDTVTLIAGKLKAIVPFDTCIIFIVDDKTGKAVPVHVAGDHAEFFSSRRINVGDGITGWVVANSRAMCNRPPELDLVGVPAEIVSGIKGVLVAPLIREGGAFGAITLYSKTIAAYTTEDVRLVESVSLYASSALNNAIAFEKTKESALTDPLTDLPNARSFYMTLEQRIAECHRLNRDPVTIISMDLDNFKEVNDLYGYGIGDRLLSNIAGVIKNQLRQMDVLARYAGDEFIAIMPMASADMAGIIAERIRTTVESQHYQVRTGRTIQLGLSLGIASFPVDGDTAEKLLSIADRNMQRDKHARKLAPALSSNPAIPVDALG